MVVLSYIRNRTTRFKTYVANRLEYIHGGSEVTEWGYVPSKVNPADVGSRGCPPTGLSPWLGGPEFLAGDVGSWPTEPCVQVTVPDCEVKSTPVALASISAAGNPCDALMGYFSSFFRLKREVAWYRRFFDTLRDGSFNRWCLTRRRGLRRREYLLSLQSRQKWTRESRNVRLGDIVLLSDQEVPRGRWRMGRIVEVFPSQDGLVQKARVKTGESTYLRPISKMVLVSSEADLS